MRSRSVIVIQIRTKDTTEGRFVEHEHMVQALAPNRTNHAVVDAGKTTAPRRHNARPAATSLLNRLNSNRRILMQPQTCFFVSIAFSLIAWGIVTARYIWPELRLRQRYGLCSFCTAFARPLAHRENLVATCTVGPLRGQVEPQPRRE